ncbi:putative dsRNA-binding protein [Deinococcus sp.]|uniref:putative dsRNA-binding protein n=1 Tax=Deinococcus sp. TaxID=47478 RepID=UPI003CC56318
MAGAAANPKGELIERCRSLNLGEPLFESTAQGPGHAPWFSVVVRVGGQVAGRGEGASKRDAERSASSDALARLVAGEPQPPPDAWPIYAEVLAQALLVAHERNEAGTLSQLSRDAAELYQALLRELGLRSMPDNEA